MSVVIMGAVVIGLVAYYQDVNTIYAPANTTNLESFQRFNRSWSNYTASMDDILNRTAQISSKKFSDLTLWSDMGLAFVDVAGVIAKTPGLILSMGSLMYDLSPIEIPAWVRVTIMTMIVIVVAMFVASLVLRREEM